MLVYLPPCSPDYCSSEPAFSTIKHPLRGLQARPKDRPWHSMQSILDAVAPADAANFFSRRGSSLQNA